MSRYISVQLRNYTRDRADLTCEYCLASETHSYIKFQIEHVISSVVC